MTDVLKMNPCGFEPLSMDEMLAVDGGNMKEAGYAFLGIVAIAFAPVAPVGIAIAMVGTGLYLLDQATSAYR